MKIIAVIVACLLAMPAFSAEAPKPAQSPPSQVAPADPLVQALGIRLQDLVTTMQQLVVARQADEARIASLTAELATLKADKDKDKDKK